MRSHHSSVLCALYRKEINKNPYGSRLTVPAEIVQETTNSRTEPGRWACTLITVPCTRSDRSECNEKRSPKSHTCRMQRLSQTANHCPRFRRAKDSSDILQYTGGGFGESNDMYHYNFYTRAVIQAGEYFLIFDPKTLLRLMNHPELGGSS